MFLTFKMWVKNIQTAGYNGARTVNSPATKKDKTTQVKTHKQKCH